MSPESGGTTKTRFIKGVLLAWIPFLLFIVPFFNAFRGIFSNKATGLGAVAGGLAEALVTFGLAAMVVTQLAAIILLARSFEKGRSLRSAFSAVSIACSLLLLSLLALSVWLFVRFRG